MKVVVALEGRFALSGGRPASHHLTYERMWSRYLDVFDEVLVVGRLFPQEDPDASPVEGPGVRFCAMPPYTGMREFLLRWRDLHRQARSIGAAPCAYILRIPGNIGTLIWRHLRCPYAVEVVGDPQDVFAPGSVRHPMRPLLRWWMPQQLRRQCRAAMAAAYVTEGALQRRYPCPRHMASYSSVELPDEAFRTGGRPARPVGHRVRVVSVGDFNQLYKAPHVVIDAVARCVREGRDVSLTLVGRGTYLPWLRARAAEHGIGDRVHFTGRLPAGQAVREALDHADLFVLPSYQEGLPRAMVEAMARGLPCIGSSVGGIPELLPPEDRVPAGDAAGLAAAMAAVLADPVRMTAMSSRNRRTAAKYRSTLLRDRRIAFYRLVREQTAKQLPPVPFTVDRMQAEQRAGR